MARRTTRRSPSAKKARSKESSFGRCCWRWVVRKTLRAGEKGRTLAKDETTLISSVDEEGEGEIEGLEESTQRAQMSAKRDSKWQKILSVAGGVRAAAAMASRKRDEAQSLSWI